MTFGEPLYLWLAVIPAVQAALCVWRLARRRIDVRHTTSGRLLPVRARLGWTGELGFWLLVAIATSLAIGALARPQMTTTTVRRGGVDFILLQDGSASMYVRDVAPDRWQRSITFLRAFGESLSWKGERVALALFAHLASPQVRLTKDPNALFFFVDHLGKQSPFRLDDNPTWDTNIEEGLHWGVNLIEKDEELFGRTSNVKAFVVISDGQAWSGKVAIALAETRKRQAVVHVIGVGTATGALIPYRSPDPESDPPIHAALDRASLREIARAGGGEYFELDRQPDREIATKIINAERRRAGVVAESETVVDLYWQFLFAAALSLCAAVLLLREPAELYWQAGAAAAALLLLASAVG
jgi:Ca-activated chloride channel family protein